MKPGKPKSKTGSEEIKPASPADQAGGTGLPDKSRGKPRKLRLWLFRIIAAVFIPILLLVLLESGLRIFGFGYSTRFFLPDTIEGEKVYLNNLKFCWRFFPREIARPQLPFKIQAVKPSQTYRIFILGSSAAWGVPDHTYNFSRILEVMLREQYPAVHFEVYNVAITAINSYVVREIIKDCSQLQPDLYIAYLGNNEVVGPYGAGTVFAPLSPSLTAIRASLWLKSTRTGQLLEKLASGISRRSAPTSWRGMEMFVKKQVPADLPALQIVYRNFTQNLDDICQTAQINHTPLVVSTVATNLKDCPPFASLHRADLTEPERKEWEEIYQKAISLQTQGEYQAAIGLYRSAAGMDDRYAELSYRLAACYEAIQDYPNAFTCYTRARELDTLRFRADTAVNQIIRAVTGDQARNGIHLVDFEKILNGKSPHGITGEQYFYEHVHFTFSGNYLLAETVRKETEKILPDWVKQNAADPKTALTEEECAERLAYTNYDRYRIAANMPTYIDIPPFTNQLFHEQLMKKWKDITENLKVYTSPEEIKKADEIYRRVIAGNPSDPWLHNNYGSLLKHSGDFQGSEKQFQIVLAMLPYSSEVMTNVAETLCGQKKFEEGERLFKKAMQFSPYNPDIRSRFISFLDQQGRIEDLVIEYRKAIAVEPDNVNLHIQFARTLSRYGRVEEAVKELKTALQSEPHSLFANLDLAKILAENNRAQEALPLFQTALETDPDNVTVHQNFAVTLSRLNRFDEAIREYQLALRLDPQNATTLYSLGYELNQHGQREEALKYLHQALQLNPQDMDILNLLGNIFLQMNQYGEAIHSFQQVLQLDPQQAAARNSLKQAMDSSEKAAAGFYQRAHALVQQGNISEAIPFYLQALQQKEDYIPALAELSWIRSTYPDPQVRDAKEALRLAAEACRITKDQDPRLLDVLAAAYAEAGQFEKAVETGEKALEIFEMMGLNKTEGMDARIHSYKKNKPWHENSQ